MRMRAARWICAALALVVCAWFALGIRQAVNTSRASAIANQGSYLTAAQVRRVSSLADSARLLNPDKEPDVLLGQAEVEHGDFQRARRVLQRVTRSEPRNIEAWVWITKASGSDPVLFYAALIHVRELEPRSPLTRIIPTAPTSRRVRPAAPRVRR